MACGQHRFICLCCTPDPDKYDRWKATVPQYLNRDIFRMKLGFDEKNARIKELEAERDEANRLLREWDDFPLTFEGPSITGDPDGMKKIERLVTETAAHLKP